MSLLSNIFGGDDLQAQGDALDAKLVAMNTRDYGPGGKYYTPENWDVVQENLVSGDTGDVAVQIDEEFAKGWNEGKANVTGTFQGAFGVAGDVITSILKGVPWWVWGLVLLYFAWPFIGARLARAR